MRTRPPGFFTQALITPFAFRSGERSAASAAPAASTSGSAISRKRLR
jgi:hypothetical protein